MIAAAAVAVVVVLYSPVGSVSLAPRRRGGVREDDAPRRDIVNVSRLSALSAYGFRVRELYGL